MCGTFCGHCIKGKIIYRLNKIEMIIIFADDFDKYMSIFKYVILWRAKPLIISNILINTPNLSKLFTKIMISSIFYSIDILFYPWCNVHKKYHKYLVDPFTETRKLLFKTSLYFWVLTIASNYVSPHCTLSRSHLLEFKWISWQSHLVYNY